MSEFIVLSKNNKEFRVPTKIFNSSNELKPLFNEISWKIIELLSRKAMYPSQIAKELNLHEQKIYYYIRQLKNANLIELHKTEELNGALAKYFKAKFSSYSIMPKIDSGHALNGNEFSLTSNEKKLSTEINEFFSPFINAGELNCRIVIGSPDPHGQFKARSRDNHLIGDLTAFLSSLASKINFPLTFLDTEIAGIESENSNLIILGGPVTNKLTFQINEHLPIKFIPEGGRWIIKSTLSGKEYLDDSIGVIQKITHPNFKDKSILLIAGNRSSGTKAAILSFLKNLNEIIQPNQFNKEFNAKIVEGLDMQGNGLIDSIEIKE